MSSRYIISRLSRRLGRTLLTSRITRQLTYSTLTKYRQQQKVIPLLNSSVRSFSTEKQDLEIFNVQDEKDFATRVLDSKVPVIVDFHATWCGPCKLLGPRLESIVGSKNGKVGLAKIDVDDFSDLAMKFDVQCVPTVMGVRNGEVQDKFIGLKDDDEINSFIEKLIN